MLPKVSIVMLNWNGAKDTIECVESLNKISYGNYDIIVVDNNSEEPDKKLLKDSLKQENIRLIFNDANLGFTGGNNIGIKKALNDNSEFVLLLNNDTIVEPDFLEPLIDVFEKHKNVGIAAPQINYYGKRKIIWTEGGRISKLRGSGFAYSDKAETKQNIDDKIVGFVSGCCMLLRKDTIEKVGMFDENFFLYVEDTDLCFRTLQAEYNIIISNKSKIYHKVGSSTNNKLSRLPLYYVTRNRLYFAKKSFTYFYPVTIIYILIAMMLKGAKWAIRGNIQNTITVKNAFSDFLKGRMGQAIQNNFRVN